MVIRDEIVKSRLVGLESTHSVTPPTHGRVCPEGLKAEHLWVSYGSTFVATYLNTHIVSKLGDRLDVSVSGLANWGIGNELSVFPFLLGDPPRHILSLPQYLLPREMVFPGIFFALMSL